MRLNILRILNTHNWQFQSDLNLRYPKISRDYDSELLINPLPQKQVSRNSLKLHEFVPDGYFIHAICP